MSTNMKERTVILNQLLAQRGLHIEFVTPWKNNVLREGYVISDGKRNACPTIYYSSDWYDQPNEKVAKFLAEVHSRNAETLDLSLLMNGDFIRSHIFPRLVAGTNKKYTADFVSIPYLDMEILLYIRLDTLPSGHNEVSTILIKPTLLERAGITQKEALDAAISNMNAEIDVMSMNDLLKSLMPKENAIALPDEIPMYVCTNRRKMQGAAVMLCPAFREKIAEIIGKKAVILPSSVHEVICVPDETSGEMHEFQMMVYEVNHSQVEPEDRLTDSVYVLENGEIRVA